MSSTLAREIVMLRLAVHAFAPLALSAAIATPACTHASSSSGPPTDAGDEGAVTCEHDPRVDAYAPNLVKKSASGALTVTLISSDPAPPAAGTNTWVVRVTDRSGAPIVNAPLTVAPFMPEHGHPASVHAVVTPQADGTYSIAPIELFMAGVWRVTIGLPATDAAPADSVDFFFCVAG